MNNTLEGINSRITEAEEWISDLENRMVEITATEPNIGKRKTKKMKTRLENITCKTFLIILKNRLAKEFNKVV